MLKSYDDAVTDVLEPRADGSSPAMPASSIMVALITQMAEPRALCALMASSIVSGAGSTCGSRAAIAAAFDDLDANAVGDLLRGKTC